MARTLIYWYNDVPNVPNLPVGSTMIWLRTTGGTCEEDRIAFLALSDADKIAQSKEAQPASATGWVQRSCGGTTDVPGLWEIDYDNGPDYLPDGNNSGSQTQIDPNDRAGMDFLGTFQSNQ